MVAEPSTIRAYEDEGFLVFEDAMRATKAMGALASFGASFDRAASQPLAWESLPLTIPFGRGGLDTTRLPANVFDAATRVIPLSPPQSDQSKAIGVAPAPRQTASEDLPLPSGTVLDDRYEVIQAPRVGIRHECGHPLQDLVHAQAH